MTNKKEKRYAWYAVQVPLEEQESDFDDIEKESIVFYGNRDFPSVGDDLLQSGLRSWEDVVEMPEFDDPEKRNKLLSGEFPKAKPADLRALVSLYDNEKDYTPEFRRLILSAATGKDYDYLEVNGNVECEWQDAYYPADEWSVDMIHDLGIRYFNNGSAWFCVDAGDAESEDPEQIWKSRDGFYHYSTEWKDEKIRQELADNVGCDPEYLKMFPFAGYVTTPSWNE
ncbi:MAG: hypothetical protein MR218_08470 [Eubacterium sp.]|nr:hypothetical protein [Eubacterium sp.]